MTAEEQDSHHIKVQGKLDEASQQLNAKGSHCELVTTKLKQSEAQHQELLKELLTFGR